MAISTYAELKTEVADFSHRSDLTSKMDSFTLLAESIINKDLRVLENEVRLEVTFDDAFYSPPSNFMALRAIHIVNDSARVPIKQYTPQQLDSLYSKATGTANGFAIHGGQIELRPAPSVSATVDGELTYYARVDSLVSNSTNDILTAYPMIYLSAMMIQVNLYLQDDGEMAKWVSAYNSQIEQANKTSSGSQYVLPQARAI